MASEQKPLAVGDRVHVTGGGHEGHTGRVEELSIDGATVYVRIESAHVRAIHRLHLEPDAPAADLDARAVALAEACREAPTVGAAAALVLAALAETKRVERERVLAAVVAEAAGYEACGKYTGAYALRATARILRVAEGK